MGIIEWATSPWGQDVPIHIALVLDLGGGDRGLAVSDRARHLGAIFRQGRESSRASTSQPRSPRAFPSRFPGIRWPRGCFTGSWRRRCSRCCSPPSCRRSASSFPG